MDSEDVFDSIRVSGSAIVSIVYYLKEKRKGD